MDHDEVGCDNFKDKKDEWLDYVKQDVLCTDLVMRYILKLWKKLLDFQ